MKKHILSFLFVCCFSSALRAQDTTAILNYGWKAANSFMQKRNDVAVSLLQNIRRLDTALSDRVAVSVSEMTAFSSKELTPHPAAAKEINRLNVAFNKKMDSLLSILDKDTLKNNPYTRNLSLTFAGAQNRLRAARSFYNDRCFLFNRRDLAWEE